MTIKNILVAYNGSQSSTAALVLACYMQKKYDAKVTGVLSHAPSRVSETIRPWASEEIRSVMIQSEAKHRAHIREKFFDELDESLRDTTEFIEVAGDVDDTLMGIARTFDIVVMGQYDADIDTRHLAPHPDTIALYSGKPVLIVPKGIDRKNLNEKALIAWDGGRSAARALSDALGIIETKSQVSVLTIGDDIAETENRMARISQYLESHGVKAELDIKPRSNRSIADILLSAVKEHDAGLLVMGAYEHSKFAEDLWGGVTNTVLKKIKVPVLMSH